MNFLRSLRHLAPLALLLPAVVPCVHAADVGGDKADNNKTPANVSLNDDLATAMKKFRVAPGLTLDLFAAEPLIQDVVSFAFDEKGRAYVVETGRRRTSVYDIRKHRDWTDADLSFTRTDDRLNFFKQMLTPENRNLPVDIQVDRNKDGKFDWQDLTVESERITLIEDTDGDGKADKSTVFADGFNSPISGVAAGVMVRKNSVWFTCIPDLWLLKDTNGDNKADVRQSLYHGFGVHIAYGGHDMHGLKFGPDGKVYWSIADRGSHVEKDGKVLAALPHTGAVFRCDPDGANFEVVASGLRNPQELVFDHYGNLFTGDNNADGGDKARWEYIVEGADYGWRYGWQHLPKLGAWNSEHLWELAPTNTAAYLLPPVAHITHGPAGNVYYPGTGLSDKYREHFFVADFPGGIRHFKTTPQGATFTVDNPKEYLMDNSADKMDGKIIWSMYPTDVDIGPGGGLYVLDWVQGWEKTGKGRLFRLTDPEAAKDAETLQTKRLLGEGMDGRPLDELAALLGHRDMRVRQSAQFAMAEMGARRGEVLAAFINVARTSANQIARIHAIWGIGQISRQAPGAGMSDLQALLKDADLEVRVQSAKLLGEAKHVAAYDDLVSMLKDQSARVQFFVATALGKLGKPEAVTPILDLLRENADKDAYVRHAGVMALVWLKDTKAILAAAKDASPAVRMASLLALRRLERPEVAQFLRDAEPTIALESARAINDVPINDAMPQLASLITESMPDVPTMRVPLERRVINANFRVGGAKEAGELVRFASNDKAGEAMRVEALEALGDWGKPSGRDRIVGLWRPLPERSGGIAAQAMQAAASGLLKSGSDAVRIAAAGTVAKLGIGAAATVLHELVADAAASAAVRIAALQALSELKDARLGDALKIAQTDKAEALRKEASRLMGDSAGAVESLALSLERGSPGERQAALQALGKIKGKESDRIISKWMDQLLAGKVTKEMQLDVLEAAGLRSSPSIKEKVKKFEDARDATDALAKHRETLYGGDAKAGRQIFFERAEAGCFRCHKVNGEGGEVGPDLAGLTGKHGRDYILEAIILPNKQIAPGFESLLVTMKGGVTYAGLLKSETADELVLNSPEDGLLKLKKADITKRDKSLSPMPEGMADILTKREIRDLLEFIATAK